MPDSKLPLVAELTWTGGLRFDAQSGGTSVVVDGDSEAGPSPMQALAFGVGGCMAADVVAILQKGRQPLTGLRVSLSAVRAPVPPRRFTQLVIQFDITGPVPQDAVDRAIALSRDTYCSALNSLRQDIPVELRSTIRP